MPARARRRRRPGHQASLRLGSLNVCGICTPGKAAALALAWAKMRLDVVLLQECKADPLSAPAVERALRGWRIFWAHNTQRQPPGAARRRQLSPSQGGTSGSSRSRQNTQPPSNEPTTSRSRNSSRTPQPQAESGGSSSGSNPQTQSSTSRQPRRSAGVAIAIRAALLQEQGGPVRISKVQPSSDGRLISLQLEWGGHQLRLASIYMPNQPTEQRQFMQTSLGQLAAHTGKRTTPVWAGDFNFVEDQRLDRVTTRQSHAAEQLTAAAWQARIGQLKAPLVDAFRHLHPSRKSFSHFSRSGAARLDRFYVGEQLLSHVAGAAVGELPPSTSASFCSDHRPVTLQLTPKSPTTLPHNPVRRLRLHFVADPVLARQFQEQAAATASEAPAEAAALVAWWPGFKRRITAIARRLNWHWQEAQRQRSTLAWEQQEQLYQRFEGGDTSALPALLAHRQQLAASVAAEMADASKHQRRQWLHNGERPAPSLTKQLQAPAEARGIPALRSPAGSLHSSPKACAELTARYWAGISSKPNTSKAAQRAVLATLAGSPRLSEQQAAQLGCCTVAEKEVRRALRRSKPGTAPGRDGIPIQLYRKFSAVFQPLLTRLFCSIGASGQLPRGFPDGVISVLYKKGQRSDPANYRPITLLNTDYRLLAKVLAGRLGATLPNIIGAEQTAFLRGRSIGENCLLLQLLPHLLAGERRWAMVVLCDFRKAYDTVDRAFLFEVMSELGLGAGFLHWTQLLLSGTRAAALVNGHLSRPASFQAGVRQGCPLAPLLYLCLGQALLCFLQHRGIGVAAAGKQLTAVQFADDCKALLPGGTSSQNRSRAASFVAAMRTFGAASGQQLAEEKTKVLPIGAVPTQLPDSLAGLRVVPAATALGLTFRSGTQPPEADWQQRLEQVEASFARLARLGLSAFGRGMGSAAYGVSQLLYQAEHAGMPPSSVLKRLSSITAKLVDRGQPPTAADRRFAGVASALLAGNPRSGGFGALPWEQHVRARHAAWGVRLALAAPDRPWAGVAAAALQQAHPHATPLTLLTWRGASWESRLPPALLRMWHGLRALPPLEQIAEPPPPGPWCCTVPVWSNLLLPSQEASHLDWDFDGLQPLGSTIPQLLLVHHQAQQASGPALATLWQQLLGTRAAEWWEEPEEIRDLLAALVQLIPAPWQQAAWEHLGSSQQPTAAAATALVLQCVGWRRQQAEPLALEKFKVRHGTHMQLQEVRQQRLQRFAAFEELAAGDSPNGSSGSQPDGSATAQLLRQLWRLPWANSHKETYWRLALNGLPLAARMTGSDRPCSCGSSGPLPGRRHHFWECPVAAAVVSTLAEQLSGHPLSPANLWLAQPPAGVHEGVWQVVCLASIAAMETGRRLLAKQAAERSDPDGRALATAAGRHAAARTWILLQDFCSLGTAPASWQAEVPPAHPFIHWQPDTRSWQLSHT